jgi:hypothetical protein
MITIFVATTVSDPDIRFTRLERRLAERLLARWSEMGFTDGVVLEQEVNHLPGQRVRVDGSMCGYQFSRTKMGQRTVRRTVRNLREDDDGVIVGEAEFKGRTLRVAHRFTDQWVATDWRLKE